MIEELESAEIVLWACDQLRKFWEGPFGDIPSPWLMLTCGRCQIKKLSVQGEGAKVEEELFMSHTGSYQ